jgi:AraC-like DNA-binding protein
VRQKPRIASPQSKSAAQRYVKFTQDPETTQRVAQNLRQAVVKDQLYLNPNLSLWTLARHLRMSDSYVSQVLNESIGVNFFDFVNGYQIVDAKKRLLEGTETILNITYDVGFNSRS